ncbi:MAG TPA: helix-turn-helix domain-containing protein, partial [Gemmataceae bacterium]|nr:helix-turn-helix domain-containing protein [Gemmataceae bacterium]
EIRLPPLRERRQDIPELARHLLGRAARRPVEQVVTLLSPEAVDVLLEHEWPGNVREMANVMEHAFIISGGQRITPEHLPHHIRPSSGAPTLSLAVTPASGTTPGARTLREIEMEHVLRVLEKHGGNKPAAAAELGISLKTMYNKLNQLQEERKTAG